LVLVLIFASIGCNAASRSLTPTPSPTQKIAEPTETGLPPIDAASTALAQLNITQTAQAPTETPTPPPPETGEICTLPFKDENENGEHETAEYPLEGVEIVLTHDEIEIEAHLRIAERGPLCFSDLPPGSYQVTVHGPPAYINTNPSSEVINLGAGQLVSISWAFVEAPIARGRPVLVEGGPALGVALADSTQNDFYLMVETGLARTDDGGKSWTVSRERVPANHLVSSPADPDLLYAGDGQDCFRGGDDIPMFTSKDGGQSWHELPNGLNLRPATAHPTDPEIVWAIGCAGVYRSEDGGSGWQLQEAEEWGLYTLAEIIPVRTNPEILYASGNSEGGSGALFRSEDAGTQWVTVNNEFSLWINDLLVSPTNPDQIWIATPSGVWHSSDGGAEWRLSAVGLEKVTVGDAYEFEGRGLYSLAQAEDGRLFLGTEQGLYLSSDGGATWSAVTETTWETEPVSRLDILENEDGIQLWVTAKSGVYVITP
jgi:photosystem II stability/assembly factor-like uncharacterized protein